MRVLKLRNEKLQHLPQTLLWKSNTNTVAASILQTRSTKSSVQRKCEAPVYTWMCPLQVMSNAVAQFACEGLPCADSVLTQHFKKDELLYISGFLRNVRARCQYDRFRHFLVKIILLSAIRVDLIATMHILKWQWLPLPSASCLVWTMGHMRDGGNKQEGSRK